MRGVTVQLGAAWLVGTAVCVFLSGSAFGLVLHPEDDDPPPVRPLDAAVGRWVDNASCVPVGPNYVITTRHQRWELDRPVWIDGVEYRTAEIFNHYEADLRVVRIALPDGQNADLSYYIPPYTGTQERHKTVVIGGYGMGRGDPLETPLGVTYGYTWAVSPNDTLRWGANRVEGSSSVMTADYATDILTAGFDAPTSAAYRDHEAAPAAYDSGGGWFIDISGNGDWRVAGLTRAVEHGPPTNQTWFRNSVTGQFDPDYLDAVRVGSYAQWINGAISPSVWNVDASGNWADLANWSSGVPDAPSTWAVLGDAIADDRTVTLDAAVTLGTLRIDSGNRYTVQGTGSLVFDVPNSAAGIEVNRQGSPSFHGAHVIGVPIALAVPLVLNTRSDGDLTLAGAISGPETVTKRGEGTVILAVANTFSDGLVIEEGTVRATDPAALGPGEVVLDGGSLDLRSDTDAAFAGVVTTKADAAIHVQPVTTGSEHTLSFDQFNAQSSHTLTITGTDGYCLGVSGMTTFNGVPGTVTVDTASADLALAGGLFFASGAITKTGPREMAIAGAQSYGNGMVMRIEDGTVRFDSDAGPGGQDNLTVRVVAPPAAVEFGATQHVAGLEIADGAARVLAGTGSLLVTRALSIDQADAHLDLADGAMILDYTGPSPMPQVTDWIRSGLNAGAGCWDGNGIVSSAAATDAQTLTAVGVLDNADANYGGRASFLGEDVDATSILARWTWWGDADLDGVVDSNDYDRIDNAWVRWTKEGLVPDGGFRWAVGDFTYDGTIDSNDYDLIDRAWMMQTEPMPAASDSSHAFALPQEMDLGIDVASTFGTVPEPATVGLLGLAAVALVARRRR